MLLDLQGSRSGTAILCEDLIRRLIDRVGRSAPATIASRLAQWFADTRSRATERLAARYRRRSPCPVCERVGEAEQRYLESMLTGAGEPEFRLAYARSDGLCAPHAMRAVELVHGRAGLWPLLQLTLATWSRTRQDLTAFIAKHDYRNTSPFTEAEAASCRRALELLSGGPGLFGNDLRDRRG